MSTGGKIVGGLVLAGAGVILIKLVNVNNASDEIQTELVNPRIHKIDPNVLNGGIVFRTGVQITNPTKEKITITQPYVLLTSAGETIASSTLDSGVTVIQPKAVTKLVKDIEIKLKWSALTPYVSNLVTFASKIFSNYKNSNAQGVRDCFASTPLEMVYRTKVNGSINYTSSPTKLL